MYPSNLCVPVVLRANFDHFSRLKMNRLGVSTIFFSMARNGLTRPKSWRKRRKRQEDRPTPKLNSAKKLM